MLAQTVKIILSPFNPNIEVVGPMVFDVRSPYSDKSVTLVVNPNIIQYEDKPLSPYGVKIRQSMASQNTDQTRIIHLDIKSNTEEVIYFKENKYKVKLLNIGNENIQGQNFPFFEFYVEEL